MTSVYGVFTSAVNTQKNLRYRNVEAHTHAVVDTLKDMLQYMLDLETGQRGFIIVGEKFYLAPYQEALTRVDVKVALLASLTRDHFEQHIRIGRMKKLLELRKASLKSTIDARRNCGLEAAMRQVKNGGGKIQMNRLREQISEMHATEKDLLAEREDKLMRSLRRTDRVVIIAGCVAITSGVLGANLLLLFLSARDREERLRARKEKTEEADRAKSDFLTMMGHEICTPTNAILGFGELLHDIIRTPKEKHFASAILTSGNSLLSFINDILDLSKIEAGKIDI